MPRTAARRPLSPVIFLGALLAGAFLVLVGVSMAQEFRRRYALQQHIGALRADIAGRESRIADLQRLKGYLATDEYVERVAREKLNYQKPGERVVVVPSPPTPSPTPVLPSRGERTLSPARAWFLRLFGPPTRAPAPFGGTRGVPRTAKAAR